MSFYPRHYFKKSGQVLTPCESDDAEFVVHAFEVPSFSIQEWTAESESLQLIGGLTAYRMPPYPNIVPGGL